VKVEARSRAMKRCRPALLWRSLVANFNGAFKSDNASSEIVILKHPRYDHYSCILSVSQNHGLEHCN
jgi:hypothetical protein